MLRFGRSILGLGARIAVPTTLPRTTAPCFNVMQTMPLMGVTPIPVRLFSAAPIHCARAAPITQSSTLLPAPATAPKLKPAEEGYISKIQLRMLAFDYAVADSYVTFVRRAAAAFGIECSGRVPLPTQIRRLTILKSPHVYKKHRIQYEQRIHKRLVQLTNLTEKTANVFLEYIELNIPAGVGMKIKKTTLEPRGLP